MSQHQRQEKGVQPTKVYRIGLMQIAIWVQDGKYPGSPMFKTQITRSYQSETDGKWYRTTIFNQLDLCVVAQLTSLANTWITVNKAKFKAAYEKAAAEAESRPQQQAEPPARSVTGPVHQDATPTAAQPQNQHQPVQYGDYGTLPGESWMNEDNSPISDIRKGNALTADAFFHSEAGVPF